MKVIGKLAQFLSITTGRLSGPVAFDVSRVERSSHTSAEETWMASISSGMSGWSGHVSGTAQHKWFLYIDLK